MTVNRRYSAEGVEKAEHLYCCSDHWLRGVAELTDATLRTPKRWSGKNGWGEKKSEIGRALIEIRSLQRGSWNRYQSGTMRDRSGSEMAPCRYHVGINPVSCRQHSGAVQAA